MINQLYHGRMPRYGETAVDSDGRTATFIVFEVVRPLSSQKTL